MKNSIYIAIIAIVAIAVGVVFFTKNSETQDTASPSVKSSERSLSEYLASETVAGQTTYTNTDLNYSLTLPDSWVARESGADVVAFSDPRLQAQDPEILDLTQGMLISVYSETLINSETFSEYVDDKEQSSDPGWSRTVFELNGYPAAKTTSEVFGYNVTTSINRGFDILSVSGSIPEPDRQQEYLEIYEDVMASLQF